MITVAPWARSVSINERPYIFTIEGARQIARREAIDDPNRTPVFGMFHHLEDGTFDDHILQVKGLQFCHGDGLDELGMPVLLRISRVQALFVLDRSEEHTSE